MDELRNSAEVDVEVLLLDVAEAPLEWPPFFGPGVTYACDPYLCDDARDDSRPACAKSDFRH